MLRILESQAPAKQTATDTINTLSSRLSSATLLEDRRAAILGLRSFAKGYPASVASGALRDLLATLRKDGEDSDTTKVVLETLLMLFEPDEQSPEASEEITLWLADEFTQRQDNITALLDLLETGEFYLRLYSLQILSHVCAARPQRTHEAVLAAPLGVSRITAVLDDKREAARNEALLLLVALTPSSAELQKVVAFENAFDKVLVLIESEGGLTHGSTTVQDCLSLLANLLTLNTSNQAYFREIGCITKVAKLLADVIREEESVDGVTEWIRPQRDMNLWGLLAIIQLFLVRGSQGTAQAQTVLWQNRVILQILQIAFHPAFSNNVRSKSLETCGDIIRANSSLQEQFGDLMVRLLRQQEKQATTNGHASPAPGKGPSSRSETPSASATTNVIEALLELTLEPASLAIFDVRLAACNCFKAFIEGHNGIRGHVLRRAMEGHQRGDDTIPNILTVLSEPSSMRSNSDPYQVWMASVLLLHILYDNADTKSLAQSVSEGNAEEGEEVVTLIQSLASNVVAGVQHVEDERALLGDLMLLATWLFEDPEAVNDLLGEGSNIQGLIAAVKISSATMPLVAGLGALLLGIIYEFSTKDSPIPRAALHDVLMKNLSREMYIDRLTKLRESPFVRDFEVLPTGGNGGLPDVYFDKTFMDFLKDNFSRLLRAIDRDPTFEASIVFNGVQKGVSRDLVDSLRAEVEENKRTCESTQVKLEGLAQKLEQEELEHRRTRDSTAVELGRIKQINESLQRNHEEEVNRQQQEFERHVSAVIKSHEDVLAQLRRDHQLQVRKHEDGMAQLQRDGRVALEDAMQRHQAEKRYLEQRQSGHEREMSRLKENAATQQQAEIQRVQSGLQKEIQKYQTELEGLRLEVNDARSQYQTLQKIHEGSEADHAQAKSDIEGQLAQLQKDHTKQQTLLQSQLKNAEDQVATMTSRTEKVEDDIKSARTQAKTAGEKLSAVQAQLTKAEARAKKAEENVKQAEERARKAEEKSLKAPADTKAKELQKEIEELRPAAARAKDIQTELDDLLVVFADLEAKRATDKARLKELGEEVSDDEDEGDEAGEEEDEEEEDDVD